MPEADRIEGEFSRADRETRCEPFSDESPCHDVDRGRKLFCVFVMSVFRLEARSRECQLASSVGRSVAGTYFNITHSSSCSFSPRNSTQSFMPFVSFPNPDNVRELAPAWERTTSTGREGTPYLTQTHSPYLQSALTYLCMLTRPYFKFLVSGTG